VLFSGTVTIHLHPRLRRRPLFFSPVSELYGCVSPLQLGNLWYLAWNFGCSFATNNTEMFVFRFLAGVGGSAPLAIGVGALR
jgi:MFS family permease